MKTFLPLLLLFVVLPSVAFAQQQTMQIKVYFPNTKRDSGDCVVPVYPVTRTIPKTKAVAKAALDQLFAGPTSEERAKGFYSDFSDATRSLLISVNIRNRYAYVNMRDLTTTSSIGNFTTSCGGSNFFGQVESTLKQFPGIRRVFFAFEGDPSHFYDWMQIGECPREIRNCNASNFINGVLLRDAPPGDRRPTS
jgi:spore germination protein GerM